MRSGHCLKVTLAKQRSWMADETKTIGLGSSRYRSLYRGMELQAPPKPIAKSYDSGGRPLRQHELCQRHADQVVERERAKGREIVSRGGDAMADETLPAVAAQGRSLHGFAF